VYDATHRRQPRPTTRGWRAPLALLVALAALLLPVSVSVAAPGTPAVPDGPAGSGDPGAPARPGAAQEPDAPVEKPEPVWTGVPGTNLAHDTYGYPWPAAPDCDESDVASGGCVNDGLGFFQGQCTSWVAFRLGQRNGLAFSNWFDGQHWGNASEWSRVAKGLDYTSDRVPSVGAVGWYARGHVSYVEDVNSDGSVVISEMNTDGHNGFVVHTVYPGETSWPDRFLHLGPVTDVADTTAPTQPSRPTAAAAGEGGGVELVWESSTDYSGVAGYRVLRNGMPLAETDTASYVDRQASPGHAYTYSVVAYDGSGNLSEAATTVLDQGVPASRRQRRQFLPGSAVVVPAGDRATACGRLGSERDQRVGCRLRTPGGWATVRTGRSVAWGLEHTRAFVTGADGRIWYCRVLGGATPAQACLPLDVTTRSWGFDRVGQRREQPADATWVPAAPTPTRCGLSGDRATCTTLVARGWRTVALERGTRPGDPLSRAFLGTDRGTAFCRTIEGRATCTELEGRPLGWGRPQTLRGDLPHGRWVSRPAGPTLCLPAAGCRTLGQTKG